MDNGVDRLAWFNGDVSALELYETLTSIAHKWDDLIDGDKAMTKQDINGLMALLLIKLPANLFYRKHFEVLQPLIITGVISYMASVRLETSDDPHKLELAHVLRYSVHQVAIMMMAITSGFNTAADTLATTANIMIPETFSEFYKEHTNATE